MGKSLIDLALEYTAPMNFSPRMVQWGLISLGSAVLSRRVHMYSETEGYEYPTIYTIVVANPGMGKTFTMERMWDWFISPIPFKPNLASATSSPQGFLQEFLDAWKNQDESFSDHSPLLAMVPEFMTWFNGKAVQGMSLSDLLLSIYDSRSPGTMWKRRLVEKDKTYEFANPALTLYGCCTPSHIQQSKFVETAGTGFVSRCFFVCEPHYFKRNASSSRIVLNDDLRRVISDRFRKMSGMHGKFSVSDGGYRELQKEIEFLNDWMSNNNSDSLYGNFIARRPTHIKKLSIILSAFRSTEQIIQAEDVIQARNLFEEMLEDYMFAFGQKIKFNDTDLWDSFQRKLPPGERISHTELMNRFAQDGQALPMNTEVIAVLQGLVKGRLLKIDQEGGETFYERL